MQLLSANRTGNEQWKSTNFLASKNPILIVSIFSTISSKYTFFVQSEPIPVVNDSEFEFMEPSYQIGDSVTDTGGWLTVYTNTIKTC